MIKSSEPIILVESVQEAVKFYTEKLSFDLVNLQLSDDGRELLAATVKKSKCVIHFKEPKVEEQAEFSFIKRCPNRCISLFIELKAGLDAFFQRCAKKRDLVVLHKPEATPRGYRSFALKDPFGLTLVFAQALEANRFRHASSVIGLGLKTSANDVSAFTRGEEQPVNALIAKLKTFGVLRRAAKKFAKLYFKTLSAKG